MMRFNEVYSLSKLSLEKKPYCTVVDVNNTARWFLADNPKDYWDHREDFPCVLCPWDMAYFEYANPRYSQMGKKQIALPSLVFGFLISTQKILPEFTHTTSALAWNKHIYTAANFDFFQMEKDLKEAELSSVIRESHACYLQFVNVYGASSKQEMRFMGSIAQFLDKNGQEIPLMRITAFIAPFAPPDVADSINIAFLPVAFSLCLCHAKNTTFKDHQPDPKLIKSQIRKKKEPSVTYKTLVIDGLTNPSEPNGTKGGITRALHLCRGHFRTYTAEKPLFGKHTGLFWTPMHTRGDKSSGEVKKKYVVKNAIGGDK